MRLQITLEILLSMALSLLIVASVLHSFRGAEPMIAATQNALQTAAENAATYVGVLT
jgi:hypothetical protein